MGTQDLINFDQAEYEQIIEQAKRKYAEKVRVEGYPEEYAELYAEEYASAYVKAYARSEAKGRAKERRDIVAALVGSGKLTREEAAELLGVSVAELDQALAEPEQ